MNAYTCIYIYCDAYLYKIFLSLLFKSLYTLFVGDMNNRTLTNNIVNWVRMRFCGSKYRARNIFGKTGVFFNLFRLNACRYISLRLFFKSYQISHVSLNVSLNFSIKKLFKTPDGDYLCSHAVYKLNVKDFQLHT